LGFVSMSDIGFVFKTRQKRFVGEVAKLVVVDSLVPSQRCAVLDVLVSKRNMI